jgi:Zn-dependent membrane protease YugP
MPLQGAFVWSGRIQAGIALFALSLLWLAVVAPNEVAISCAIGGGASLALYGIGGGRLSFGILALLALVTLGCALFAALVLHRYALLPVALGEATAIMLIRPTYGARDYDDDSVILGRVSAVR